LDYSNAENEGHIMAKITVDRNMCLREGDRFIQGLFVQHGVTNSDNVMNTRTGGMGSTGV